MDCPDSPSSTSSSPAPHNSIEAAEATTENEDALASAPPSSVQSADDLANLNAAESESESKLDENEISPPSSPSATNVDDTRTELEPTASSDDEPPPDTLLVSAVNCENFVGVAKTKDASTQTEIFATETDTINSTALLTSTVDAGGLPDDQPPVITGGMENANKQHALDIPGVNTALDHTVLDYNNLTFMSEEKNASNDDECCNDLANQWRDTMSAPDYDDDRRDHHSHQNPCPCFLPPPAEQDAVSAAPQWYHSPMHMPNYAQTAAPSGHHMPSYAQPAQPAQMPSYPQPSPSAYPHASPHPMQPLPAYQYYPPYSNYGMYYNNRTGCYYPNSGGGPPTHYGHPPPCYEGERPYWWNMNGRRWPESKDDFCSFGCDRRRRCRREVYVETPRSRCRTLPVKTIMKETSEKDDNYQEAVE